MLRKVTERLGDHAVRRPDKVFLIDLLSGRRWTYGEFNSLLNRTCRYLESLELKAGETFSVVLENSVEFCLLYFAAFRSGIVVNPYPADFSAWDIRRDTEAIQPKIIFIPTARRLEFQDSRANAPAVIPLEMGGFLEILMAFSAEFSEVEIKPADYACLYQTAGRLSDPRGAFYTHGNISALIPSIGRGLELAETGVHYVVLPLAHTAALNYSLLPAAWLEATVVLARDFWSDRERFWTTIRDFGVSYVQTVPSILHILLHQRERTRPAKSLRFMPCGSAPLSPALRTEFESEFRLPVADLYGLTETGPTHADAVWKPGWARGTIGKPLDCNEVIIVDDEGFRCSAGAGGEIAIRGGNVFPGYAINPAQSVRSFRGDWFLTGDLGVEDADGYFHFVGRKKDLIIRGGLNVHPGEIDEVLLTHPSVASASTRGAPDDFFGELIRSEVVLRPGHAADEGMLKSHCRRYLSPVKVPDVVTIRS